MAWENVCEWLLRGFDAFLASASYVGCWLIALFVVGAIVALIDHQRDNHKSL